MNTSQAWEQAIVHMHTLSLNLLMPCKLLKKLLPESEKLGLCLEIHYSLTLLHFVNGMGQRIWDRGWVMAFHLVS